MKQAKKRKAPTKAQSAKPKKADQKLAPEISMDIGEPKVKEQTEDEKLLFGEPAEEVKSTKPAAKSAKTRKTAKRELSQTSLDDFASENKSPNVAAKPKRGGRKKVQFDETMEVHEAVPAPTKGKRKSK